MTGGRSIATVMAKRSVRLALLLVTVLSVQVIYVVPAHATDGARAVSCCAAHCHHQRSFGAACRCCQLRPDTSEVATLSSARCPQPSVTTSVAPAPATCAFVPGAGRPADCPRRRLPRAAPLFLLTRTLRL